MKYIYSFLIITLFSFGFAASDEESSSQIQSEALGKYSFVDENNMSWTIDIKEDKTMTAIGNGKTYYGQWDIMRGYIRFYFSGDTKEYPRIMFKTDMNPWISNDYVIGHDGFLYGDGVFKADAHNPDYRVKIHKR
ncbi:MAG: hypothetical protein IKX61_07535 [Prevotella sp.]|nr:hypothetical protein [Prevotella sp.]